MHIVCPVAKSARPAAARSLATSIRLTGSGVLRRKWPDRQPEPRGVSRATASSRRSGRNDGDAGDVYAAGTTATFGDTAQPGSRWWDGTSSGLRISQIAAAGGAMTFKA
jgi:hypothetical protein